MLPATLSVAAVAGALLFIGTSTFGSNRGHPVTNAQIGIGTAVDTGRGAHAAPKRADPSVTVTNDGPRTAEQPALPESTTAAPTVTQRPSKAASQAKPTTQTGNATPESRVVDLVNAERAKVGCSALTVDSRLTVAARGHSSDMATRNYFSHDTLGGGGFADRVTTAGYTWSAAGENIAMGQATAESVMAAWMNSAGHKANILSCGFHNIGVGLAYNPSKRPYWTQDFGTLL